MEPSSIAASIALRLVLSRIDRFINRNDDAWQHQRVELALLWGAELKSALPRIVEYLEARVDNLEEKLGPLLDDPQLGRVYTNFAYEAAREAIDERRRMLAHAAAGLIDPGTPVERKARVERKLRELDPADVLALHGVKLVPGADPDGVRANVLFSTPSGDVLVAAGCVRVEMHGGGGWGGGGAASGATVTQIGHDVLASVRSYLATRSPPFDVPGREPAPDDRTEEQARHVLGLVAELGKFAAWAARHASTMRGAYERSRDPTARTATLTFYLHEWTETKAQLDEFARACEASELRVLLDTQPYKPAEGTSYEILRVEIQGPHDLLRYVADDCEAFWR